MNVSIYHSVKERFNEIYNVYFLEKVCQKRTQIVNVSQKRTCILNIQIIFLLNNQSDNYIDFVVYILCYYI
jgi:hypothetical protein